jgi:hypothetical protein
VIYSCDLPSGQTLYLENQGDMTNTTVLMKQSGQQQQSGSSVMTGTWQIPPEVFSMGGGAMVRLTTATGVWSLMVQGMSLSMQSGAVEMGNQVMGLTALSEMPNVASSSFSMPSMTPMTSMPSMTSMTSMPSMTPMPPMGMSMNPMQMQMGNMGMSMGRSATGSSSQASSSVNAGGHTATNARESTSRDSPGNASGNVSGNASGNVKFCSQCGTGVKADDRFCSSCGHSLR